jgi:CheY-like chemotaxis protein
MPKTLLLADDSVTVQRVVELTFAHEDVRVVAVSDGRRAVQTLDADGADIVLVDVEVPEMDGYAVAAHMKKSSRLRDIPVILLAGALGSVDEERAKRIGCAGVLIKPFEPGALVSRVRELLDTGAEPAGSKTGLRPPRFQGGGAPAPRRISLGTPEPLEPPRRPMWESGSTPAPAQPQPAAPVPPAAATEPTPPPRKVSLVNAFSALLQAERSSRPAEAMPHEPAGVSEAAIEEAVRRVLVRMTGDTVRQIVAETAERLVREEIARIKDNPD